MLKKTKAPGRQIVMIFVSIMAVMLMGIVFGARRADTRDWEVFEFLPAAGGVTFELEHGADEIHAILINESEAVVEFGREFALVKFLDGEWRVFPFGRFGWTDDLLFLPPGYRAANIFILREDIFAYDFMPGSYRIVTTIRQNEKPAHVWANFELTPRN